VTIECGLPIRPSTGNPVNAGPFSGASEFFFSPFDKQIRMMTHSAGLTAATPVSQMNRA